jgi:hypothetical protein
VTKGRLRSMGNPSISTGSIRPWASTRPKPDHRRRIGHRSFVPHSWGNSGSWLQWQRDRSQTVGARLERHVLCPDQGKRDLCRPIRGNIGHDLSVHVYCHMLNHEDEGLMDSSPCSDRACDERLAARPSCIQQHQRIGRPAEERRDVDEAITQRI